MGDFEEPAPGSVKTVVLTSMRYYLPGNKAGGPIRSIANLVEALGDEIDFRIVTFDRDVHDQGSYPDIRAEAWTPVGKAYVFYVAPGRATFRKWQELIAQIKPDVLYLNSLFDPVFTLLPLFTSRVCRYRLRKVVIAPRGELSPGALKIKWLKKSAFFALMKLCGFFSGLWWHVSTADEAALVNARFGANERVIVARNLSFSGKSAEFPVRCTESREPLHVVFLSRIDRKKNVEFALRVLMESAIPIVFDIWGPVWDLEYWRRCNEIIEVMPKHIQVRYCGIADHDSVGATLADYDLFFLPTAGENYGHAIVEALHAGTPVLISDQTPWTGLEKHGVGWDLPLESGTKPFVYALEEAFEIRNAKGASWRDHVKTFALIHVNDASVIDANREVFAIQRTAKRELQSGEPSSRVPIEFRSSGY